MGEVISPIDVFVKTTSLNFWWAVYGLGSCLWEDIFVYYKDKNSNSVRRDTEVITKGYFRELVKFDKEGVEEECEWFGKSLEEILISEEILFGYSYDEPSQRDVLLGGSERRVDPLGIKPNYVGIFHPAEELNGVVLKEAVKKYCREICGVAFCNIYILEKPKRSYVIKTFREEERVRKKAEEYIKSGGKFEVRLMPQVLEQLFGTEEVERFGVEIDHGFIKDGEFYVKLKDGREERIGEPDLKLV